MNTTIQISTTENQPFILLPALVNGKGPFDLLLDTGANMTIVTQELAHEIGIEGTEFKEALGSAGKKIEIPLGKADSISIGDIKVEDIRVGILQQYPKCTGSHGGLGYNFFKDLILTINYPGNLMTISSFTGERNQNHSLQTYVPLRLARPDRPIILVDVLVNAIKTYQFILDTGASQTVVSPELAQRMGITISQVDSLLGVGGVTQSSVGILRSVSVGEASLENVTAIVSDIFSHLDQALDAKLDGILGFNFLRKFKLEIDYPNETLGFEAAFV